MKSHLILFLLIFNISCSERSEFFPKDRDTKEESSTEATNPELSSESNPNVTSTPEGLENDGQRNEIGSEDGDRKTSSDRRDRKNEENLRNQTPDLNPDKIERYHNQPYHPENPLTNRDPQRLHGPEGHKFPNHKNPLIKEPQERDLPRTKDQNPENRDSSNKDPQGRDLPRTKNDQNPENRDSSSKDPQGRDFPRHKPDKNPENKKPTKNDSPRRDEKKPESNIVGRKNPEDIKFDEDSNDPYAKDDRNDLEDTDEEINRILNREDKKPQDIDNPIGNRENDKNVKTDKKLASITESFIQTQDEKRKMDIIWVIDNSPSMSDEQKSLGQYFNLFIDSFLKKDVDFQMAITTTDARPQHLGKMVPGSSEKLNSHYAKADPQNFRADFMKMIKVGVSGSGKEKGLQSLEGFLKLHAKKFLREDAYLAVVIVSDEEDQSPQKVEHYTKVLKAVKSQAGFVKVYSIVDTAGRNKKQKTITPGYARYAELSMATGGKVFNILDDFQNILSKVGKDISNLVNSFPLSHEPVESKSIIVKVDGRVEKDFTYDKSSRSIVFKTHAVPRSSAEINVSYSYYQN